MPTTFRAGFTLEATVVEALEHFLHPLTGGPAGQGWAFGRKPHKSDLYALLETLDGVDHVQSLEVKEEPDTATGTLQPDRFLVFSGAHKITLVMSVEEI